MVQVAFLAALLVPRLAAQEAYDHTDLTVVRTANGEFRPITSTDDWSQRRGHILAGMQQAMGSLPDPRAQPDFDVRVTERLQGNGFERVSMSLVVEGTDRLPFDLYLPTARDDDEKRPAVLALHPTGALGKRIVAGAKPNRQYATELAERGYVVLAPDYPGFGDLKDYDFAADDYISGTMKGIVNHMRCVDYLQSRDEVDGERIGVIGHSLGGHNALFVAAFDKRLKVAVTSCGWTPFHYYYGGNVKGWTSDRYMPLIRDKFELNADKIPFDFYEVIAAIAPRAVYSASPIDDANFAVAGVKDAEPKIRSVFERVNAAADFIVEYPGCAHDFPKSTRSRTYAFIDKHLKFSPVTNTNFEAELPRIAATEPQDALKTFTVHPDFKLELAAHEPDVVDPIAACFDGYGRLYVVEMRGYSEDREQGLGRVRRLEDRNNDGVFEHSVVFAKGFKWPTAIVPYDGGVFVAAAPHIYYLKDGLWGRTDGEADVDPKTASYSIVLTGLKHTNVQGLVNSMRWGIDGRIHVATSSSGAELFRSDQGKAKAIRLRGRDFSFDPRILHQALRATQVRAETRLEWGDAEWKAEEKKIADAFQRRLLGIDDATAAGYARVEIRKERLIVDELRAQQRYRKPARPAIRAESGGGQHGMCFDDAYNKFVCQNSNHIQHVLYKDRYAARAKSVTAPASRRSIAVDGPQAEVFRTSSVEPWRLVRTRLRVSGLVGGPVEGGGRAAGYFTGATGTTVYRGDAWPAEFRGQAFVGDVGSNIVHRKTIVPDGTSFRANRAREGVEFIASTDNWFRPAQFLHGPDGNLYIVDMYRETIEHPKSLPPQIKKHLDLTSGRDRGRIYRVVSRSTRQSSRTKRPWYVHTHPLAVSSKRLPRYLNSENAWQRETVSRILFQRQDKECVEPLRTVAREGSPLGRLHALNLLSQIRFSLDDETLLMALSDDDPVLRRHAVRLSEPKLSRSKEISAKVVALADDDDAQIRQQVAFSAYRLGDSRVATVLKILKRDSSNPVVRFAAVSSSGGKAFSILQSLAADTGFRRSSGGRDALVMLADAAIANDPAIASNVLELAMTMERDDRELRTMWLERLVKQSGSDNKLSSALRTIAERQVKRLSSGQPKRLSLGQKLDACRLLILHPNKNAVVPPLLEMIKPASPQELQLAAVESLGETTSTDTAAGLLNVYKQLTPKVQQAIVSTLLTREPWTESLLQSIAQKALPGHTVPATRLRSLAGSRSAKVRELVAGLNAEFLSTPRAKVVADWLDVLKLKGNGARGREVFRKNCAKCHRLENFGEQLGPGLAAIRNRGVDAVLMNILDPNRELNPQYSSYAVATDGGRTVTGMITSETASGITVRDGEKVNVTIARDEIDEMRNTGLSLMPDGLEKQINKQQMADLLRYLMTVRQ